MKPRSPFPLVTPRQMVLLGIGMGGYIQSALLLLRTAKEITVAYERPELGHSTLRDLPPPPPRCSAVLTVDNRERQCSGFDDHPPPHFSHTATDGEPFPMVLWDGDQIIDTGLRRTP